MNCKLLGAAFLAGVVVVVSPLASVAGTILPISEADSFSDMGFLSGALTGGYDTNTGALEVDAGPGFAVLDIGTGTTSDWGLSSPQGPQFVAQLTTTGVVVDSNGEITDPGTVTVTLIQDPLSGGAGISADYGITPGATLFSGPAVEVFIDNNNLQVAFDITSGALQFGSLGPLGVPFATTGIGVLNVVDVNIPSDFSTGFSLSSNATVDIFGIPEPATTTLLFTLAAAAAGMRNRRSY